MQDLNPIELPLNKSALIEASAGTGKTFTMANLYLRLILGVGCSPLTVEQILVVTFTKAATEELKDRIRKNIRQCADFLKDKANGRETQSEDKAYQKNIDFLERLYPQIADIHEALLRLSIAEREIDAAAVFTIHSFCQKMLFQFAFDSGVRFDIDLQPDESDLLKRLSEEVWREQFYPQGLLESEIISGELKTPAEALVAVYPYLFAELPELDHQKSEDFSTKLKKYNQFISEVKNYWKTNSEELVTLIRNDLAKKITLHGGWYRATTFEAGVLAMERWANSDSRSFPGELNLFTSKRIAAGTKKSCEPMESAHLSKNQEFQEQYKTQFEKRLSAILRYQFLIQLRSKMAVYKQNHAQKSFNDMLTLLNQALKAEESGVGLAEKIRSLYPFAMIDEFQDTDLEQYEIFSRIFMSESADNGFIMIGDPKQSIYKFRGADIFTYLKAATQAEEKRTLAKNWRSLEPVVQAVNNLFSFAKNSEHYPFLYPEITFQPVVAKESSDKLVSRQEKHFVCYSSNFCYGNRGVYKEIYVAEQCAYQIHQQLEQMEAGLLGIQSKDEFRKFEAKDIAILVRSKKQAKLIKQALAERNIKSVFLAEDMSVFESAVAYELLWVLQACLNPYRQTSLISALGSTLWGLTAEEIYQYKADEIKWDSKVNEFVAYNMIWKEQGVLPMLHKLYLEQKIIQRLRGMTNSDRLVTDLLHLTELLQETAQTFESEAELVRWYERQLANPKNKQDSQILRLESEDKLIKIVTIHGSKGLQYPIVWLPFVAKNNSGMRSEPSVSIYRDLQGKAHWHFGTMSEEVKNAVHQEEFAEDLRLLYVALTRAESQLNLILPTKFNKGWNSLHYLLANGELGTAKDFQTTTETKDYFEKKGIDAVFIELAESIPTGWYQTNEQQSNPQAKNFTGNIKVVGQVTSFTSLYAQHERNADVKNIAMNDLAQDRDLQVEIIETDYMEEDNSYSPYLFPHSTKVGTVLHGFFERCRFGEKTNSEQIAKICEQLNLTGDWVEPTKQWFETILHTKFAEPAFCLNEVSETQRLNEWQFYLRLKNDRALIQLNGLLRQYSRLAKQLPDLKLPQLEGFVRGFVDCIVQMNGKFYVIDYKSNFLGYLPQDYSQQNIQRIMGQYRYDLQYLLYTLAVHRYLKSRLGENYDYERDFGGVAYLFLRGMNGTEQSGVYFDKPSKTLIEEMDTLFG